LLGFQGVSNSILSEVALFTVVRFREIEVDRVQNIGFLISRRPLDGLIKRLGEMFLGTESPTVFIRFVSIQIEIADHSTEVVFLTEVAQDLLYLPNYLAKHLDLIPTYLQDLFLDGVFKDQVNDDNLLMATEPLDATDPLFDLHRVPRQIKVNHHTGKLQVKTFTGLARANEYPGEGVPEVA